MHEHEKINIDLKGKKKIILLGNPNVGKSVIFSLLTGRYVTVSNYPGTTVEISTGKAKIGAEEYVIFDSPGINTLIPTSEDEKVARDILLKEKIDLVIQVSDAKNLRRGLLLSGQFAEMGIPFVLDLNMADEARDWRINIDSKKLSQILEVDCIFTVATQRIGINNIVKSLNFPKKSTFKFIYDPKIEEAVLKCADFLPSLNISKRSVALMILAGDNSIFSFLKDNGLTEETLNKIIAIQKETQRYYTHPLNYVINHLRLKQIEEILNKVIHKEGMKKITFFSFLEKASVHSFFGIPVLLFVLWVMYKFVGEFGAQVCVNFLENTIFASFINPWAVKIVNFLFPLPFIQELFVGEYGIITMALTYSLAIVLPIVGTFFIFFGFIEDVGYLPRLSIMADKLFRIMGLNGKAVLPMVLGLGCDTMATMTARILDTKKERIIITLLLALGVPCSAQLGVILGMLAGLSAKAALIWAGVVIVVILLVGFLASMVIPGEKSPFILEIPPLRWPKLENILIKTLARMEWYLKEAVPLFILGTLMLFFADKIHLLKIIEKITSPVVVGFLGLPAKASEAFIIGFLRRDYGAAGLFVLAKNGQLDPIQVLVSLVTITLFVPCIAQFFMTIKERGLKTALYMIAFIFPFAFLIGGLLNFVLRSWRIL